LNAIQSSGKTLHNLINDILDFTKIEAGMLEINKEIIDIKKLILEIKNTFTFIIKEKKIDFLLDFDKELPSQFYLDEFRLKQVIINLVGNAIKFTDNGYIKISVIFHDNKKSFNSLNITVEDTGIGIPLEAQSKIFNVFQQQDNQDTTKYGGTGLGLSISLKLIKLMHGEINIESQLGIGSKFTISLTNILVSTDKSPDSSLNVADTSEKIDFKPATVLIVDDVESNRELIKGYLDDYNFKFLEADNGLTAIEISEESKPDLILMDLRMPGMDGYEKKKKIKENSTIPIVILTASNMDSEKSNYLKYMIDGYLLKPVSRANILNELKKHLKFTIIPKVQVKEETDGALIEIAPIDKKVIEHLNTELMKEWESLKKRKPIEKLKVFSNKLIKLGKDNQITTIEDYGNSLLNSVNLFDITEITNKLNEFPKLVANLN